MHGNADDLRETKANLTLLVLGGQVEVGQIEFGYNHQAQRFLLDAPSSFRAANFNCHHPAFARLYRVGQDRPGEFFSRVAENSNTNLNQLSWAINMVCVCSEDSLLNFLQCSLPVVGFYSDSSSSSCRRSSITGISTWLQLAIDAVPTPWSNAKLCKFLACWKMRRIFWWTLQFPWCWKQDLRQFSSNNI